MTQIGVKLPDNLAPTVSTERRRRNSHRRGSKYWLSPYTDELCAIGIQNAELNRVKRSDIDSVPNSRERLPPTDLNSQPHRNRKRLQKLRRAKRRRARPRPRKKSGSKSPL